MRALKRKLIRVYNFVTTKRTFQIWTDSSCDMLARTLTLEPENSIESQLCHSVSVWLDKPSNLRFFHRAPMRKRRLCELTLYVSKQDANMRGGHFHSHCYSHHSKATRTSSGSWVLGHTLHVLTLSLISCMTWRKELLWFFQHWFFLYI